MLPRAPRLRIGWLWALVVFLTFPLLTGGALLIASLLGSPIAASEAMQTPLIIPIAFVIILFSGGPLQEEFGWRATLLDPLQDRFGALGASLAVGTVWALWHIPLFAFPHDTGPYYGRPFWGLFATTVMIWVLFTWVWNHTGRSVAAVMLFHTMFNLSHWVFPVIENDTAAAVQIGAQLALVVAVVIAFGPARLVRSAR